jgi:hypothetical protein
LAVTENCFWSCQFRHAPQLPYGHDISPCDFFLFGDRKAKLKDEELESMEEVQDGVKELQALDQEAESSNTHSGETTSKDNYPHISFTSEE